MKIVEKNAQITKLLHQNKHFLNFSFPPTFEIPLYLMNCFTTAFMTARAKSQCGLGTMVSLWNLARWLRGFLDLEVNRLLVVFIPNTRSTQSQRRLSESLLSCDFSISSSYFLRSSSLALSSETCQSLLLTLLQS